MEFRDRQEELTNTNRFWKICDPASLKVRLTLGIAAVSAIGLGGLATWTSMRMQQLLISTHKENIEYIVQRFPLDVEIYSNMVSLPQGAQRAIDNLSAENILFWVKNPQKQIVAKSQALAKSEVSKILSLANNIAPIPQVQNLHGRYWLMCATPLQVNKVNLGTLYVAQDITEDRIMLSSMIRSLSIATVIVSCLMTILIALYINRSLQPLKRISQLTASISADKLNQAHIHLENAPTEVKELAETCDRMLMRLAEAWESQQQLLSNVSHELRTPLTIISGYIQSILRRGNNLSEIQKEALYTASSEADRTVQLLQDLLDLARVDSGRMHFQLEKIVLNDLIEEIAAIGKQYSDRIINIKSPLEIITIQADLNRLKQILFNLIDNAIKYSDPQTAIDIEIKQQGKRAIIQVSDRGVGISLPQQGRIFERFYRVDEARNRAGGTGLGLSIVKTLIEGMGGSISVVSQVGEGSIFTISFPVN